MTKTLRDKGFDARDHGDDTIVSLNRFVSFMEIEIALGFEVTRKHMVRTSNGIVIMNQA